MKETNQYRRNQKSIVFNALLLFNLVLVVIQLWLFVSALEGILHGRTGMVVPGAIASLAIMGVNIWMLIGIGRLDRSE
ncbi:MAG TPA: DUF6755 family protein [Fimbriimonas sp.]